MIQASCPQISQSWVPSRTVVQGIPTTHTCSYIWTTSP